MATNYVALARENRVKALNGQKHSRHQDLAMSDCAIHPKLTRRMPNAVFMSTRNSGMFTQANLH